MVKIPTIEERMIGWANNVKELDRKLLQLLEEVNNTVWSIRNLERFYWLVDETKKNRLKRRRQFRQLDWYNKTFPDLRQEVKE